jgi:hypothetical protein
LKYSFLISFYIPLCTKNDPFISKEGIEFDTYPISTENQSIIN